MSEGISRRTALRTFGAAAGAFAAWPSLSQAGADTVAALQKTQAAPRLVVLTAAQYATVDAIAETIIPADDHSPGARAARVADYVDLVLSESEAPTREAWAAGLVALDRASRDRFAAPFARASAAQQAALLTELSRTELAPQTPLETFFKAAKGATIRGYYTSEIGLRQELQYQGNAFVPEFVGCTHPEHR